MSDRSPHQGPTTRAEFETALVELIRAAQANGVPVDPGIDVRDSNPDVQDWTVEIYPLRTGSATDRTDAP